VGEDGATHHGVFDLAYLRCIPNMIIYAPRDEIALQNILYTAQLGLNHPIAIRYPRGRGVSANWQTQHFGRYQKIEIGKSVCIKEGSKVAVLSNGTIGNNVSLAISKMKHPETIAHFDFSFVKPLDENTLKTIFAEFITIVTIEEGAVKGGFGSAILELYSANNCRSKIITLGIPDEFIEHGTVAELQQYCKIDVKSLEILFSSL
jgi:1-deoxy-D-xylulose-5-phosphate synthase